MFLPPHYFTFAPVSDFIWNMGESKIMGWKEHGIKYGLYIFVSTHASPPPPLHQILDHWCYHVMCMWGRRSSRDVYVRGQSRDVYVREEVITWCVCEGAVTWCVCEGGGHHVMCMWGGSHVMCMWGRGQWVCKAWSCTTIIMNIIPRISVHQVML